MKKLGKSVIKSLVFSAIFLIAGNLTASIPNTLKIEIEANQKSIFVSFNNTGEGDILIQIKDDNDAILHTEEVSNQPVFAKKFNLKNLPAGVYYLEVSDELTEVVQPLKISVSNIEMDPTARTKMYKPVFRFQNNRLDVDFLAINNNKITISVFGAQNQLVFSEQFENAGKPFGKRFDMDKLEKGKYSIKIAAGNQTYYKTVEVK